MKKIFIIVGALIIAMTVVSCLSSNFLTGIFGEKNVPTEEYGYQAQDLYY